MLSKRLCKHDERKAIQDQAARREAHMCEAHKCKMEAMREAHKCQMNAMREVHERNMKATREVHEREMRAHEDSERESEHHAHLYEQEIWTALQSATTLCENAILVHHQSNLKCERYARGNVSSCNLPNDRDFNFRTRLEPE
jgi:hypothetical protein